ncbi:PTS system N-acetylglucosamine-specific IIB component (Glc family) /PTS system N-acetylglucosamine-specific IIC component (Glc family) [Cytobacillus firmus]|uniref:PTS system N-acetylglucosamine-specific IIB component (Glc family) /PTS system N-acetylglucosamine-specific IIC component (Glc family) n=2 Tax=Cytobacillus TaxID=2675230 RepID=A0A366K3Q1_CYTFI|nr:MULTISPECIES: N-acetylglucosamine-specific PTS transporter subunit IIBC [Cytobacillus]RBP95753.1 PTS system N-acetylglucosamine-specific IIB component (Glc family) /PTS system N-acetylglucosamine-specific IIC component (Glc family) [Cytobacillus firmus]TDX44666.1 PTS system N-acetylglucosamine-specific IIB component (Glc family) /PTS system N-acetylglucosamine-specific IIC component (Glc family) [Cytobacillus oceanisediminis]
MLGFLQRIGKSLMLPIAVMPAAALLLRLGQDDLLGIPFISAAGNAVFGHLALLFAIGIAIGFSKDGSGAAALAGAVGYFVLTEGAAAINETVNMGVFGGIISGIIAGLLYNKYHDIRLPEWLGFFGGKRFVPIITSLVMIVIAFLFGYVWPPVQAGINGVGDWIIGAGAAGVGVFGFLNRLLIPVGLHHILNTLVWFEFGEFTNAAGDVIKGDLWRFLAKDPSAGIFMTGFFPIMMFGLPGAAFAMVAAAKKERRKAVAGAMAGLAFTSFLTGITEPIEFLFMFLSPVLYFIHAILTGLVMSISYALDIHHGFGFSAGALDYFLNFGIAQKPVLLAGIGLLYGLLYFVVFYFLIKKLDLKTPGREDEIEGEFEGNFAIKGNYAEAADAYLEALGGRENLEEIDNCVTRLRLKVKDIALIDEGHLKQLGAKGVIKLSKTSLQVIVGTDVEFLANELKKK